MTTQNAAPAQTARLELPGHEPLDLPIIVGTEDEHAIDIAKLRAQTGYITLDEGYRNTGSVRSEITFIDGEAGILRYRGIPIEDVCANCSFIEAALLLIYGELPTADHVAHFRSLLTQHQMIHEGVIQAFHAFPANGHPMAILSATINAISAYQPEVMNMEDDSTFEEAAAKLISKVRTLAAGAYRTSAGLPIMYPKPTNSYCENFLHLMFSNPHDHFEMDPDVIKALSLILILHADHEQNCSTSTVRMVGSSGANLFASVSAGVAALSGPLHGGANVAVINQLNEIEKSGVDINQYLDDIKATKGKLYGFGHGVYKNYDPRARILKASADKVLDKLGVNDPLLNIARRLEEAALNDEYFTSRKLYPNVDFYSGIIMRAMGIPSDMFTVMFAIGRMPGWIANWKEVRDTKSRIYRPRQVYTGPAKHGITPMDERS
ncbi:citrate synthase [Algisphaera agarilytica]|uniref:Citrate synthase n=1 Tax=Algisphaera agarilytica TaxID=1385975 RepID=A0A7X0H6Y6_9BACT|nr:citrate synthase [Algisphaera agarilytica]MBB6430407.1 citrate synthase [Algisphaera agarilytica]